MQFNAREAPVVSSEFCKDQSNGNKFEVRPPVVLSYNYYVHEQSTQLSSCVVLSLC